MPIRFRCGACNQPVEVDDEAAGQSATCPYCKNLTPVPRFSNFESSGAGIPVASPSPGAGVPLRPVPYPSQEPAPGQSRYAALSWLALACAVLSIICYVGAAVMMKPLMAGIDPADQKKVMEEMIPRLQANPSIMITGFLWMVFFAGALFCGVIAVILKARPLWPAVAALVCSGLFIALFSCGLGGMLGTPSFIIR